MKDELVEAAKNAALWLRAALDCKTFHWDVDQQEAAEQDYKALMAAIGER